MGGRTLKDVNLATLRTEIDKNHKRRTLQLNGVDAVTNKFQKFIETQAGDVSTDIRCDVRPSSKDRANLWITVSYMFQDPSSARNVGPSFLKDANKFLDSEAGDAYMGKVQIDGDCIEFGILLEDWF